MRMFTDRGGLQAGSMLKKTSTACSTGPDSAPYSFLTFSTLPADDIAFKNGFVEKIGRDDVLRFLAGVSSLSSSGSGCR